MYVFPLSPPTGACEAYAITERQDGDLGVLCELFDSTFPNVVHNKINDTCTKTSPQLAMKSSGVA